MADLIIRVGIATLVVGAGYVGYRGLKAYRTMRKLNDLLGEQFMETKPEPAKRGAKTEANCMAGASK